MRVAFFLRLESNPKKPTFRVSSEGPVCDPAVSIVWEQTAGVIDQHKMRSFVGT